MNNKAWRWKGLFILFLMVQIISCSGTRSVLRADTSRRQIAVVPPTPSETQSGEAAPPSWPALTVPRSSEKAGQGDEVTPLAVALAQVPPIGTIVPPGPPPGSAPTPPPPTPEPAPALTRPRPTQLPVPLSQAPTPTPAPVPQAQAPTPAPAPKPIPPPPAVQPKPTGSPGVVFNFDNADLYEVIRVMAEILKISYIIDPKVKGIVNIHTSGQIPTENVFTIFQTILNLNGATAIKKENVYEIVPMSDAKKLAISPLVAKDQEKLPPQERYTIQIISLKYIPVAEVSKMIKPFLSDGADIVEHPPHNILMIGDMAANVKKAVDMINLFDLDIFSDLRVRIYPILNADVTEVAEEMERIFSSLEVSTKSGRGIGITFKPIKRINSLLAVSSIPNIFDKVEGWLKDLDRTPREETKLSVFVYYVQNAKAKDLADVLKEVFAKGAPSKEKDKKPPTPEPTPRGVRPTPTPAAPVPSPAKEEVGAVPEGEITIVVDETSNALIIKAFQRDYRNIVETIKKLDLYPKQVLIEVYLAEITLDDTYKFGLEWARFMSSNAPNAQGIVMGQQPLDPLTAGLAPGSFIRYSIVELGGRISAAVNAAAADNRLNVISSPHILASNNKEAKIQIGKSQPILTSTYTTAATGVATSVVEGTIEYKDIGIILTVTPRLSDSGLVTMEIQIEKSDVNITALGNLTSVPVFDKKTAKTVLSVLEGQTIVIGGLIEDTKQRNKSGVPFLSKIPILGALFGFHDLQDKKTELILMMTPHIITDQTQSKSVTEEFRDKVEGIKKEIHKEKEKKKKK